MPLNWALPSCTAVSVERNACSAGLRPANASSWSENKVSPPASGTTTARRIDPRGGRFTNVTSVCQATPRYLVLTSP